MINWHAYKYFKPTESWGNPDRMNPDFMYLLDTVRGLFRKPFVIHCGYAKRGHSPASYHYSGRAADFHIDGVDSLKALNKIQQILVDMEANNKTGLGYYPNWNAPGFHLDDRGWEPNVKPGIFWVRLDRPFKNFALGYHYNDDAEEIVRLL